MILPRHKNSVKRKTPTQLLVSVSAFCLFTLCGVQSASAQTQNTSVQTQDNEVSSETSPEVVTPKVAQDRKINVQSAADNLASILGQAKENGLLQTRGSAVVNTNQTSAESIESVAQAKSRCGIASVLDMSDLQDIHSYEDLSAKKDKVEGESELENAIHLARLNLSLGLGTEAKAYLTDYNGEDVALLLYLADIIDRPAFEASEPLFSRYGDCNASMPILSLLETPTMKEAVLTGIERRDLLSGLNNFPEKLKEIIAVRLATQALENNQDSVAKAIWRKLDNDARENQTRLPIEKTDRDEYLYLDALFKRDSDPAYYKAVLRHLSDRETVYQLKALKLLSELNRNGGFDNKAVEANLEVVTEILPVSDQKRSASFELVKNRIYAGQVLEAIDTTKQYFAKTDAEYLESALQVRSLVEALLVDPNSSRQFMGLNNYLYDTLFYEITGNTQNIKHDALTVAISSGLPQLYPNILGAHDAPLSPEIQILVKQAKLLMNLKDDTFKAPQNLSALDFTDKTQLQIIKQAISKRDFALAEAVLVDLKQSSSKSEIERVLALTKGQWSKVSLPQSDDNSGDDKPSMAAVPDVLTVLEKPSVDIVSVKEKGWVDTLPNYLSDIDETVQKTKAYLKNG